MELPPAMRCVFRGFLSRYSSKGIPIRHTFAEPLGETAPTLFAARRIGPYLFHSPYSGWNMRDWLVFRGRIGWAKACPTN